MHPEQETARQFALPARRFSETVELVSARAAHRGIDAENEILGAAIGEWDHDLCWLDAMTTKFFLTDDERIRLSALLKERHQGVWGPYSGKALAIF